MEIFINMKRTFKVAAAICLAFVLSVIMFTIGTAAMGNMAGTAGNGGIGAGTGSNPGAGVMSGVESSADRNSHTDAPSGSIGDRAGSGAVGYR